MSPPGPRPVDMLRDLPRMLRDPLAYLLSARQRWGDVVAFPMPRTDVWFVDAPAGVRRVLQDNHRAYGKRTIQYDTLALVTGDGLLVADPPSWRQHRRVVQPAFHRSTLAGVVAYTASAANEVARSWAAAGPSTVDVDAAMMRASLRVVGAALFGADLRGNAASIVEAVLTALDGVVVRARSPWQPPLRVPTVANLRVRRALATIDAAVAAMVEQRRRRTDPGDDVLAMLVAARGAGDLGDRGVRDEIVTLLIAGHETVASALTWTWWLLASHPAEQAGLHAELDELLAGRAPTLEDWPRLRRTRAVVDEALRLYPPAWVVTRRALEPDTIEGYDLPAGATVITSPWTVHRHPSVWSDPEEFRPSRWLDAEAAGLGRPAAYVPFGAGPRLCIGRDFALVESVTLLAVLAQRFAVSPVAGARPPRVDALVTLRPRGGLPLTVSPRAAPGIHPA